jgi:hypothetical protein
MKPNVTSRRDLVLGLWDKPVAIAGNRIACFTSAVNMALRV